MPALKPPAVQETEFKYQQIATPANPFRFCCKRLYADGRAEEMVWEDLAIAYETYGTLSERRDNAVLLFHALTGSQHAAGYNPTGPRGHEARFWNEEVHMGWWEDFIGPGKALDTNKYFVICANYLGGCYGSTGPATVDPETGKPYGARFPQPTISDIVDSQMRLLDALGINHLLAVIGGSIGGCAAVNLALRYPDRVHTVIPIAAGLRATVLAKALNFEQIYAIEEDKGFNRGDYYGGDIPTSGLTLARMISHKTFISLGVLQSRAKKKIIQPDDVLSGYRLQNQVESYMLYQGRKFVRRFDPASYLRILHAWQSFDLPAEVSGGDVHEAFRVARDQHWLIFTINTDVCFYPDEQEEMATALKANNVIYQHITVHSDKGHDSFLLEPALYTPYINYKLGETLGHVRANYQI